MRQVWYWLRVARSLWRGPPIEWSEVVYFRVTRTGPELATWASPDREAWVLLARLPVHGDDFTAEFSVRSVVRQRKS